MTSWLFYAQRLVAYVIQLHSEHQQTFSMYVNKFIMYGVIGTINQQCSHLVQFVRKFSSRALQGNFQQMLND